MHTQAFQLNISKYGLHTYTRIYRFTNRRMYINAQTVATKKKHKTHTCTRIYERTHTLIYIKSYVCTHTHFN